MRGNLWINTNPHVGVSDLTKGVSKCEVGVFGGNPDEKPPLDPLGWCAPRLHAELKGGKKAAAFGPAQ